MSVVRTIYINIYSIFLCFMCGKIAEAEAEAERLWFIFEDCFDDI